MSHRQDLGLLGVFYTPMSCHNLCWHAPPLGPPTDLHEPQSPSKTMLQVFGEDHVDPKPLSASVFVPWPKPGDTHLTSRTFPIALSPPSPSPKEIYRGGFVIQLRFALHNVHQELPPLPLGAREDNKFWWVSSYSGEQISFAKQGRFAHYLQTRRHERLETPKDFNPGLT